MIEQSPLSLIHDSRVLAEKLRSIPEVSRRLIQTEKVWQYRTYQGSDPASMIDWKQSARTASPVVREHEPIKTKETFLWASLKNTDKALMLKTYKILCALGFLLTYKERTVGWIFNRILKTHYTEDLSHIYEHSITNTQPSLPLHNIKNSFIILASNFAQTQDEMDQSIRTYISQGNRIYLINVSDTPAVFPIKSDHASLKTETKTEPFLIELLEKVISDTK